MWYKNHRLRSHPKNDIIIGDTKIRYLLPKYWWKDVAHFNSILRCILGEATSLQQPLLIFHMCSPENYHCYFPLLQWFTGWLIWSWIGIYGEVWKITKKKGGRGKRQWVGDSEGQLRLEGECWVRKMGLGSPTNRTKYRDQEQASSMHQAKGRACVAYVGSK